MGAAWAMPKDSDRFDIDSREAARKAPAPLDGQVTMFFFFFPFAALALIGAHFYLYWRLARPLPRRGARVAGGAFIGLMLILVSFGTVIYRLVPAASTRVFQQLGYVWMTVGLYCLLSLLAIDLLALAVLGTRRLKARIHQRSANTANTANEADKASEATRSEAGDPSTALKNEIELVAAGSGGAGDSEAGKAADGAARKVASDSAAGSATAVDQVREAECCQSRRRFLMASGLLGVGVALPTAGSGFWSAARCRVPRVEVRLDKLPERLSGFSIALLSDIHAGGWVDRDFVRRLVDQTNALTPDAIFIAGDLVDGDVPSLAHIVAPLADLKSRLGTFFVIGNHEIYSGIEPWQAHLASLGIRVLRNERVDLDGLDLCGVDDWTAARRGIRPGYDLDAVLSRRNAERVAILLTHQPRGFRQAVERGIDLQLSGHTHGGQLFPLQPIARRANEGYLAGLYRHGQGQLYVSRGCGYWGPPARVGAPAEIAHLVLLPSARVGR